MQYKLDIDWQLFYDLLHETETTCTEREGATDNRNSDRAADSASRTSALRSFIGKTSLFGGIAGRRGTDVLRGNYAMRRLAEYFDILCGGTASAAS